MCPQPALHWCKSESCVIRSCFPHLPACPRCCLKTCLQLWSRQPFLCRCPAERTSPDPDPLRSHPPLQTPTSGCSTASSVDHVGKRRKKRVRIMMIILFRFVCIAASSMLDTICGVSTLLCNGAWSLMWLCAAVWADCNHIRGLAAVYWLHDDYTSFTL